MVGTNSAKHTIKLKMERTITVLSWLIDRWGNAGQVSAGRMNLFLRG